MPVDIHGKSYFTVAERVKKFLEDHPVASIVTRLVENNDDRVVMLAEVTIDHSLVAIGHAEEKRGSTQINRTSALENCETSAVGRALAFAGYGGTEIASADEVANAIHQQQSSEASTMQALEGDPTNFICTLKKYRGDKTWGWIIDNDKKYADWAYGALDHDSPDWISLDRIHKENEA